MPLRARSVAVGYYVAISLLVIGLLIALALLTGVAEPSRGGLEVGLPVASACEPGDGSPSCFGFEVRNASAETISTQCLVVPAEGTVARFTTDQSTVVLTLGPGEERTLRASVDTVGDGPVVAPQLECGPVPA